MPSMAAARARSNWWRSMRSRTGSPSTCATTAMASVTPTRNASSIPSSQPRWAWADRAWDCISCTASCPRSWAAAYRSAARKVTGLALLCPFHVRLHAVRVVGRQVAHALAAMFIPLNEFTAIHRYCDQWALPRGASRLAHQRPVVDVLKTVGANRYAQLPRRGQQPFNQWAPMAALGGFV